MSLNTDIDEYFTLEEKIKKAFGWEDAWKILPLDSQREHHWMLVGGDQETGKGSIVVRSPDRFTPKTIIAGAKIYGGPVYTQRGRVTWVLRAEGLVLIPIDTQCDGNDFLMIFDAAKEERSADLKKLYAEHW